jgi:hypothetical protein
MERMTLGNGVSVSYDKYGAGPYLVLVHGAFSNHRTNWLSDLSGISQTL